MLTGTSSATTASTSTIGASTSTTASQSSSGAIQDRFMKLLVAQLNNQDPMNPMDNAQMTSQMAQINTVTGIEQVNDTLKSMAQQMTAMQVLQGSNVVGHDVLLQSNTLSISDGKASGAVDLTARAESVKVDIMSPSGNVIDTVNLGAQEAGQHSFTWDASKYNYSGSPTFKVTATLGGKAVDNTALARDTVKSVTSDNGVMNVQLAGRAPVAYSSVKAIL